MLTVDAFLAAQYDVCDMVCSRLDPVSLHALSRACTTLQRAVSQFYSPPLMLLEDEQGDFTRTYDPVSGRVEGGVELHPSLAKVLDVRHPKGRGRRRRLLPIDNGCPDGLLVESSSPGGLGRQITALVSEGPSTLLVQPITPVPSPLMRHLPPPIMLPREFEHCRPRMDCPVPPRGLLPRRAVDVYEGYVGPWEGANVNPFLPFVFEQAFWARDLRVMVLRKGQRVWLMDPASDRRVLLPELVDVSARRQSRPVDMACQDGQLFVLGVTQVRAGPTRWVQHKKLYVIDLRAYVANWRAAPDARLREHYVRRVEELVQVYEGHTRRGLHELLVPHVLLNLANLNESSRTNVALIVAAINGGVVVPSDATLRCLGRVTRLGERTQMDTFPYASVMVLRAQGSDRHYLVSTRRPARVLAARSFERAGFRARSLLPLRPAFAV